MCIQADPTGWKEKKKLASTKVANIFISRIPQTIKSPYDTPVSSDEEDNDDDDITYNRDTIQNFAKAIQYNYLLDTTFHDSGILSNNKFCFCPCSKKMSKWREIFGVSLDDCDICDRNSTTKPMSPNAFMDHIAKVSEKKMLFFTNL